MSEAENETVVQGALQAWAAAFNEGDAGRAAALYAPDAILWGTVSTVLVASPQGIREYFERAFSAGTPPSVTLGELVLLRTQGESAVCSGAYTFTVDVQGQSRSLPARFSFAYRKAGQGWLVVSHHSSLMPAAIPARYLPRHRGNRCRRCQRSTHHCQEIVLQTGVRGDDTVDGLQAGNPAARLFDPVAL